MFTYVWRSEYYREFIIGGCTSREDAIQHLRTQNSTDAGYVPGDHHFTDDRLIVIPNTAAGTVGMEVWKFIQSLNT